MTNEVKQQVMREIEKHSPVFLKVSPVQYRIRCPICGDSQKNLNDSHCYIKCSFDPGEPILYNCFKCNTGGVVNKSFLEKLHVNPDVIGKVVNQRYNRISSFKKADINIITGTPDLESKQVKYIEWRLGHKFTYEELDRFKIVWDMSTIFPYISNQRVKNSMPSNLDSVSFLSDDRSTLLTRFFDDTVDRWRKVKLFPTDGRSMYTIKAAYDLFKVDGPSDVFIAEGIMDVISIFKNIPASENSAYIAVLGSDYNSGIDYAIAKGIFGSTVHLHVYIDQNIDTNLTIKKLRKYKWLYGSIEVVRNLAYNDMGTTVDKQRLLHKRV